MKHNHISIIFEWIAVCFWLAVIYKEFFSRRRLTGILAIPGRITRIALIIVTLGFLGACANTDPLAVASGPVFALNAGHWQPTPQELAPSPVVVNR